MWWLPAVALAAEGPLYSTDWTAGVDGASRSRVAQVVRAHETALLACLDLGQGSPVEVRFEWEAGKPVGIEASAAPLGPPVAYRKPPAAVEVCVEHEISRWRAEVRAVGPYAWELGTSAAVQPPTVAESIEELFPTARLSGDRMLLVADVRVPGGDDIGAAELAASLRPEMPAFAECVEEEAFGDAQVAWTSDGEMLRDGRVLEAEGLGTAAGRCLADAGEGLPFFAMGTVQVRFSVWKLGRDLLAPEEHPELEIIRDPLQ